MTNKKRKVLILGVASVQMDALLVLKELGYETYAIAMKDDGPGSVVADHFEEINILDSEKIIKYIKDNQIELIYSVGSDLAMPIVSLVSRKQELPHFVNYETAKTCNNKDLMRMKLKRGFLGNIDFQILESGEEKIEIDYPFIIKPTDSQGQRGIFLIENETSNIINKILEAKKYSRTGKVILERYVSGPEYSVNGYLVDGEMRLVVTSDRVTWEDHTGLIKKHIVPSDSISKIAERRIKEMMEITSKKLGILNGPVYAQIKVENDLPYIIEITPRLDGCHMWKLLELHTGVNLLRLTFQHLLENDTSELKKYKMNNRESFILDFFCQEPNTNADYKFFEDKNCLDSFKYYTQDQLIRPINGKKEKIAYSIYKG